MRTDWMPPPRGTGRAKEFFMTAMKRFKVNYQAGSNVSCIIIQAQTRWDARSTAKVSLPPGAKIISVVQM